MRGHWLPIRIYRAGQLNDEAYRMFLRNSRLPAMVEGDTKAMIASCHLAETVCWSCWSAMATIPWSRPSRRLSTIQLRVHGRYFVSLFRREHTHSMTTWMTTVSQAGPTGWSLAPSAVTGIGCG